MNEPQDKAKKQRGRPFAPGDSRINRKGRSKGLASFIQSQTRDGQEIAAFWLGVMRDGEQATRDRISAAEHLANRGWGRPTQMVMDADGNGPGEWLRALLGIPDAD